MPRANRYFLSGYVWHITHRCHQRQFLLKFGRDRCRYLHWLFKAKKRFDLCVLDYMVTSNHIGTLDFVERVKSDLGIKVMHREAVHADGIYALREPSEAYARRFAAVSEALRSENTFPWNESL